MLWLVAADRVWHAKQRQMSPRGVFSCTEGLEKARCTWIQFSELPPFFLCYFVFTHSIDFFFPCVTAREHIYYNYDATASLLDYYIWIAGTRTLKRLMGISLIFHHCHHTSFNLVGLRYRYGGRPLSSLFFPCLYWLTWPETKPLTWPASLSAPLYTYLHPYPT